MVKRRLYYCRVIAKPLRRMMSLNLMDQLAKITLMYKSLTPKQQRMMKSILKEKMSLSKLKRKRSSLRRK